MAHYRLSHLDLSTRLDLAAHMLDPEREWGTVTDLAREHQVSRKFLYQLRDRAAQALQGRCSLSPAVQLRKRTKSSSTVNYSSGPASSWRQRFPVRFGASNRFVLCSSVARVPWGGSVRPCSRPGKRPNATRPS